jgi:hypothetical protein
MGLLLALLHILCKQLVSKPIISLSCDVDQMVIMPY